MHRRVNPVQHALVPYDATLAKSTPNSGVVMACGTSDAPVSLVGPELHMLRFLWMHAHPTFYHTTMVPWHLFWLGFDLRIFRLACGPHPSYR